MFLFSFRRLPLDYFTAVAIIKIFLSEKPKISEIGSEFEYFDFSVFK